LPHSSLDGMNAAPFCMIRDPPSIVRNAARYRYWSFAENHWTDQ
jgi:hypothetical protein